MRFPDFIPMPPHEKRRREWMALALEMLLGGYIALVGARVIFGELFLPALENLAFQEPPIPWAVRLLDQVGLDSQKLDLSWQTLGILFCCGALAGSAIALGGRGAGHWLMSLSKVSCADPAVHKQVQNHWKWAKIQLLLVVLGTVMTGWVITKINIAELFHTEGLQGATRLALQLSCGIPGVGLKSLTLLGHTFNWDSSLFDVLQWLMNKTISAGNLLSGLWGSHGLEFLQLNCEPPDESYLSMALSKLVESVYLAFMATFFAIPIAFVASFFAAKNLSKDNFVLRSAYIAIRFYMNISRSIEPLIWAILFSVWVGIGPFAGAMALMIHSVSSLIKQYSEAVESVDNGPIEALLSTGASRIATVWYAVVPQVVLPYLAFTIYRWDINVRMATIIGLVGGGGIGGLLIQAQGLAAWNKVGTIAFLIFLVVWLMDAFSAKMRESIQ